MYFHRFSTRRHVGGRVVQRRDAVFLSELDERFILNPAFRVVVVVEEHHRGLLGDRALQVFALSTSTSRTPQLRTAWS